MCDKFLSSDLAATESSLVMRGLVFTQELIDSNKIKPTDAVTLFSQIFPLIIHNHYNIRSIAFSHLLCILTDFQEYLSSTFVAIPNCVTSLTCKKKPIVSSAMQCLEILFDLDGPNVWWPDIERVLLNSKSRKQRVRLMKLLHSHADEIPIRSLIMLLKDPILKVQRYAYEMILMNDPDEVQKALEECRNYLGIELNEYEFRKLQKEKENNGDGKNKTGNDEANVVKRQRRQRTTDEEREMRRQAAQHEMDEERKRKEEEKRRLEEAKQKTVQKSSANTSRPSTPSGFRNQQGENGNNISGSSDADADADAFPKLFSGSPNEASPSKKQFNPQQLNQQQFNQQQLNQQQFNQQQQNQQQNQQQYNQQQLNLYNDKQNQQMKEQQYKQQPINQNPQVQQDQSQSSQDQNQYSQDKNQSSQDQNQYSQDQNQSSQSQTTQQNQQQLSEDNIQDQLPLSKNSLTGSNASYSVAQKPKTAVQNLLAHRMSSPMIKNKNVLSDGCTNPKSPKSSSNNAQNKIPVPPNSSTKKTPTSVSFVEGPSQTASPNQQSSDRMIDPRRKSISFSPRENKSMKYDPKHRNMSVYDINSPLSKRYQNSEGGSPASPYSRQYPSRNVNVNDSGNASGIVFEEMFPKDRNASSFFDDDHSHDSIINQLGDISDTPKKSQKKPPANINNLTLGKRPQLSKDNENNNNDTFNKNSSFDQQQTTIQSIELEDLSQRNWSYRRNYLEKLHNTLTSGNCNNDYRADFLMDCVIVAAKPPHRKVAPILSAVISDVILANPEVADPFLNEIVNFMIQSQSMFPPSSAIFDDLIDTIFLEVAPPHLIIAILDYPNSVSAHAEVLIQSLYSRKPNIKLGRNDLERLLNFLVFDAYPQASRLAQLKSSKINTTYLDAINFLFSCLSKNQQNLYADITSLQTVKAQAILSPYVDKEQTQNSTSGSALSTPKKNSSLFGNTSSMNGRNNDLFDDNSPMMQIIRELKKGEECQIPVLADSFEKISILSPKHRFQLFLKLMSLLASFSENKCEENDGDLKRIFFSHFTSVKLLQLLELKTVHSDILFGLSRFVWLCPKFLLSEADQYYQPMYNLFAKSAGNDRKAIVMIAYAIEQVTGKSLMNLKAIAPLHVKVLQRMFEQLKTCQK